MNLPLSNVQCNPGWGVLCCDCKHVWSDDRKYASISPSTPCSKLKFVMVDRDGGGRESAPLYELVRFVDGSESCPDFEKVD